MEGETIKRQTRATYSCTATGQSPWPWLGCSLGCMPALSMVKWLI